MKIQLQGNSRDNPLQRADTTRPHCTHESEMVYARATIAQLRADNAVLAREVNAHRQMWWSFRGIKMDIWQNGDTRITLGETIPASSVASAIQATDASAALERARGNKP